MMPIEFRLKEILEEKELSAYSVAKDLGMSQTAMSRMKNGQTAGIRFDTLSRLCELLNCQPGDLLAYVPEKIRKTAKKGAAAK
jgi:putative transcriptional regulator